MSTPAGCASDIWGLAGDALTGTADGAFQNGVEVRYGGCLASPVAVMKLIFGIVGGVPPCCTLVVEASGDPAHNGLSAFGCGPGFEVLKVLTQPGFMNPDGSCGCTVRAGVATWGKVKSLYR